MPTCTAGRAPSSITEHGPKVCIALPDRIAREQRPGCIAQKTDHFAAAVIGIKRTRSEPPEVLDGEDGHRQDLEDMEGTGETRPPTGDRLQGDREDVGCNKQKDDQSM